MARWDVLFELITDGPSSQALTTRLAAYRDTREAPPMAPPESPPQSQSPVTIVPDADVLAADLFGVGAARKALDPFRSHQWLQVYSSPVILSDADALISYFGDELLASAWKHRARDWVHLENHHEDDHPALACAYRSGAQHILSLDQQLLSAGAGAHLGRKLSISVREPEAFANLFEPASFYALVHDDEYCGPDSNPHD
jgi:predicted nucleic acid-binding protein